MRNVTWPIAIGPILAGAALIALGIIVLITSSPSPVRAGHGPFDSGAKTVTVAVDMDTSDNTATGVILSNIGTGDSTIPLSSIAGLPTSGRLMLSPPIELVDYTGISGSSITGVTRSVAGTAAASHTAFATAFVGPIPDDSGFNTLGNIEDCVGDVPVWDGVSAKPTRTIDIVIDEVPTDIGATGFGFTLGFNPDVVHVSGSSFTPSLINMDPDSAGVASVADANSSDGSFDGAAADLSGPAGIDTPPFTVDSASDETGPGVLMRLTLEVQTTAVDKSGLVLSNVGVGVTGDPITIDVLEHGLVAIGQTCSEAANVAAVAIDVPIGTIAQDQIVLWTPLVSDDAFGPLTCSIVDPVGGGDPGTSVKGGTAFVSDDCSGGNYNPKAGFLGTDSFFYRVTDGDFTDDGEVTVTVAVDTDGDGVFDTFPDLCSGTAAGDPADANGCADAQVDADGDGICDPAAPSAGPSACTGSDNCPIKANTPQADTDGDGIGDVCDEVGSSGAQAAAGATGSPTATPTPASQVPATGFGPFSDGSNSWLAIGLTLAGLILILGGLASPFAYRAIRRRIL